MPYYNKKNYNYKTGVYKVDFYYNKINVGDSLSLANYKPFYSIDIDPLKIFGEDEIKGVDIFSPDGCVVSGGSTSRDFSVGKIVNGGNIYIVFIKSSFDDKNNININNQGKLNSNLKDISAINNNKKFTKENNVEILIADK